MSHHSTDITNKMSQRYALQNTLTGKPPARRLSPTAIWNTGPLQRPGTSTKAQTDDTMTGLDPAHSVSTTSTAMPAKLLVEAAECKARGNITSVVDNKWGSSLTNPDSDKDDHRSTTGPSPHNVDKTTSTTLKQDQHAPGENVKTQSGTSPEDNDTDGQQEQGPSDGDPAPNKGKVIDPSNWGNLEFDEAKLDPQIQREILRECNQPHDKGKNTHPKTMPDEPGASDNPSELDQEASDNDEEVITCKELLKYLHNHKTLKRLLDQHEKKQASA